MTAAFDISYLPFAYAIFGAFRECPNKVPRVGAPGPDLLGPRLGIGFDGSGIFSFEKLIPNGGTGEGTFLTGLTKTLSV